MATQSEGWVRAWNGPSAGSTLRTSDTQDLGFSFPSALAMGVAQPVSISGGTFTALTVPASALGVAISIPQSAGNNLIWKGASTDAGWRVSGDVAGSTPMPLLSTVNQGVAMGFSNTGPNATIRVWWF